MMKLRPVFVIFLLVISTTSLVVASDSAGISRVGTDRVTMFVDPASGQLRQIRAEDAGLFAAKHGAVVTVINASPRAEAVNTVMAQRRAAVAATGERWAGSKAIIFDSATRTLRRPTVAETAALVRSLRELTYRPAAALKPVAMASGAMRGALEGGYATVVIGRATADGEVETRCVESFDEATAFLGLTQLATNATEK